MNISTRVADERVENVRFEDDRLIVDLKDGRTIAVPIAWYPRLQKPRPPSAPIGKSRAPAMAFTGRTWTRI